MLPSFFHSFTLITVQTNKKRDRVIFVPGILIYLLPFNANFRPKRTTCLITIEITRYSKQIALPMYFRRIIQHY